MVLITGDGRRVSVECEGEGGERNRGKLANSAELLASSSQRVVAKTSRTRTWRLISIHILSARHQSNPIWISSHLLSTHTKPMSIITPLKGRPAPAVGLKPASVEPGPRPI